MIDCPTDNRGKKRIVILGGGFGGVYAAIHLEKLLARERMVDVADNFT
jgi:NADH dehydrogenase FAD-containing subunit